MLKLEAVNICIRALGDPAVTALDTGGNSDEGEAEAIIDRQSVIIQRQGWACNIRTDLVLELPNRTVSCSGGSGTFTYGETITQATSGATGTFYYEEGGKVYLLDIAGTFDNSHALTGGTSGATRATVTATAAITIAKHALPEEAFLEAKATMGTMPFAVVGGFARDYAGTDYSASLTVNALVNLAFEDLPGWLQEYVAWEAAQEFQVTKKRGVTDDRMIDRSLAKARMMARQKDQDIRRCGIIPAGDSTRRAPVGPMP